MMCVLPAVSPFARTLTPNGNSTSHPPTAPSPSPRACASQRIPRAIGDHPMDITHIDASTPAVFNRSSQQLLL